MGVLWADHKSKKSSRSVLLSYATTRNHFSIGLWCVTKSGFYTTTSDDKLSAWTKKKLQSTSESQTCTQRRLMVIVWWSAAGLVHYSFLNPSETIISEKYTQHINEMHWKLQHLQPAWENRTGPILAKAQLHTMQPTLWNLNGLGCEVLPHLLYAPDLMPTDYFFFKYLNNNFLQEKMLPQPVGHMKYFRRVHWILKHGLFLLRE